MGNILYNRKIKEMDVTVRYPEEGDAYSMWKYINTISQEKTYITWQGEKISLKSENEYLQKQLKAFKDKKSVQLLLFVGNKLSGISSVGMQDKIKSHIGVFGITIAKEFRGKGLGKLLIKCVLSEAESKLKNLKIITLEVFAENEKATGMYKSFGFKEYGRLPMGNKRMGKFGDDVLMYKKIV